MEINEIGKKNDDKEKIIKKISLMVIREKRNIKTHVIGLNYFFDDAKIEQLICAIKKKLGTSLQIINDVEQKYILAGKHHEQIKQILINEGIDPQFILINHCFS